jgi:hypothetical protein
VKGAKRGRTGQEQVTLFQSHDARDVLDEFRDTVEHELSRVGLLGLAVDLSNARQHGEGEGKRSREGEEVSDCDGR